MKKTSLVMIGLIGLLCLSVFWQVAFCSWSSTTPLPRPLYAPGSVSHGNRIYVVGGYDSESRARDEVYYATIDPTGHVDSGGWIGTTELPEARMYPGVAVYNDWVYVLGGSYTSGWMERDTVWFAQFNPDGTISNWAETTRLPYPMHEVAAVEWNGRFYVLAGWNGFSQHNDVYFAEINETDGTIGSWSSTTSLPEARAHDYTAVVHDGTIYFIGGTTATTPATFHQEVYFAEIQPTGQVGIWTETSALPVRMGAHTSVVYGDDIFVIGGFRQPTYPGYAMTDKVLKAHINPDHTLDAWAEWCTLPAPLCHHSSTVQGSRSYVIGGQYEGSFSDVVQFLSMPPEVSLPWRDDFDYNSLAEMRTAGWMLDPDYLIAVGGGELTLVNDGSSGSSAWWTHFATGISDYRAEIKVKWTGGSYASFYLTLQTGRHTYTFGGDGYYPNFVYARDSSSQRLGGYSPTMNARMTFVFEKNGNTINLYWNDRLIKTDNEPDPTSSLTQISFTSGWISTNKIDYISVASPEPEPVFLATVDFDPNTLNLRSNGRWITCYVELPEGYDASDVDTSAIMVNDTIPVDPSAPKTIGDYDNDGVLDLMVKFDRAQVSQYILDHVSMTEQSMRVTLTVTGKLNDGAPFRGSDTITVFVPMQKGRQGLYPK